jgi:2-polyprenyl-3-methyl-5-hydroxy-6-metoxy-1,4-benzoquinol methylase
MRILEEITHENVTRCIESPTITVILTCGSFDKSSKALQKDLKSVLIARDDLEGDLICLEVDGDDEDAVEIAMSLDMGKIPMVKIFNADGEATTLGSCDATVANIIENVDDIKFGRVSKSCCAPGSSCGPSTGCCAPDTGCAAPESAEDILKLVKSSYAKGGCCVSIDSTQNGYSIEELAIAAGANLGLGCGNPLSFAELKAGEVVVDLGSGAGIDCFIAAQRVGPTGRVIGIDMTPDMLHQARINAKEGHHSTVSFRLGEIEYLPVADNSVDVVISNCVINLSPDKPQVFREIYRILKPGGRVAVCDVVARENTCLPDSLRTASALAC